MDRYDEYKNVQDKASFFKNLSSFDEKKTLWDKLNNGEKKGLLSRLGIDVIKSFLSNMDSVERKSVYELFDEKKLRGYYNSLNEDDKKKMTSEINDRNTELREKKQMINNNLIENYNLIDKADRTAENFKSKINKAQSEIQKMDLKVKRIEAKIVLLSKAEKLHKMEQLKKHKPSILDKVGIFKKVKDKIRAVRGSTVYLDNIKDKIADLEIEKGEIIKQSNKLKSQLERDLKQVDKLNEFKRNVSANVDRLIQNLDNVLDSSKSLNVMETGADLFSENEEPVKDNGVLSKQKNIDFTKLSDDELYKLADKFSKINPIPKYYEGIKEAVELEVAKRKNAKIDYSSMSLEELQEIRAKLEKGKKRPVLYIKDRENYRALLLAITAKNASVKNDSHVDGKKNDNKFDFSSLSDVELEEKKRNLWEQVVSSGDSATEEEEKMLAALDGEIKRRRGNNTKEKVNSVQNKIADLEQAGVYFENNDPIGKEFVVNGKPIDKLSDREMIILAEIINNKLRERGKSIGIDQEKGVSRTLSKGNVSFGLLVGIVILLLTLLFMIF